MVKYIKIKDGTYSVNNYTSVDDDMYDFLSQWEWKLDKQGYVYRHGKTSQGESKGRIFMHQIVNQTPKGYLTDHKDRVKLNNTIKNLRTSTHSLNVANIAPFANKTSKYKGVMFKSGKWRARITKDGTQIDLGIHMCEHKAAEIYNKKAVEFFGEFAYINQVENHENCELCKREKDNSTFRGVYYIKENKYRTIIRINKKNINIGYFSCAKAAAEAFNAKAIELKGNKAKLNNIEEHNNCEICNKEK